MKRRKHRCHSLSLGVKTRPLSKLRSGKYLETGIDFSITVEAANAADLQSEWRQILDDLNVRDTTGLKEI